MVGIAVKAFYQPVAWCAGPGPECGIDSLDDVQRERWDDAACLESWRGAEEPLKVHSVHAFSEFLPQAIDRTIPGDTFPLPVQSEKSLISALLRQIHSGAAFHSGRKDAAELGFKLGAYGCFRARKGARVWIDVRIHATFRIDPKSNNKRPFWFTPAMIAGTVALDLNGCNGIDNVAGMLLELPTNSSILNVDLEFGVNQVDICRCTELRLCAGDLSCLNNGPSHIDTSLHLKRAFYDFAQVAPFPSLAAKHDTGWKLNDSFLAASKAAGKTFLHVIVLWGALDDESC